MQLFTSPYCRTADHAIRTFDSGATDETQTCLTKHMQVTRSLIIDL